jgi:exodeoxyribonuclease VIII
MATHSMLDLETLGTSADAHILSIGAVKFDPAAQDLGASLHLKIDNRPQPGAVIDAATVLWWMKQPEDARAALLAGDKLPLGIALARLRDFLADVQCLWSNGPTFDEAIARRAFQRHCLEFPVHFAGSRCFRTVRMIGEDRKGLFYQPPAKAHDALEDAMAQARHVQFVMGELA